MQVKLCGVTNPEEARSAQAAGVDFVGLHFQAGSPWRIDLPTAQKIRLALGQVMPVGVFADQPMEEVVATASRLGLTWIQLNGDESFETAMALAGRFTVVRRLTPVQLKTVDTRLPARYAIAVYLVDGRTPAADAPWAWHKVHGPTISHRPIWLAGGLDPETVIDAVTKARPSGVDVTTGVRDGQGVLVPERLQAFVANARATWEALPPEPT